jgi:chemotaxis protein histidine kinase CheA/ActR/RegA family two-component response regulator
VTASDTVSRSEPASAGLGHALKHLLRQAVQALGRWHTEHGLAGQGWRQFERLQRAVATAGLPGLEPALEEVHRALLADSKLPQVADAGWTTALDHYLEHYPAVTAALPLIAWLEAPARSVPLAPEAASELLARLQALPPHLPQEAEPAPNPFLLELPERTAIHPELLQALCLEFPDQCAGLAELARRFGTGQGTDDDLRLALRLLHTIKGAGHSAGVPVMAEFAHALEGLLESTAAQRLPLPAALAASFERGTDTLAEIADYLQGSAGPTAGELQAVLQQIKRTTGPRRPETALVLESATAPESVSGSTAPVPFRMQLAQAAARRQERLRLTRRDVDGMLARVGESLVGLARLREQLQLLQRLQSEVTEQVSALEEAIDFLQVAAGAAAEQPAPGYEALTLQRYADAQGISNRLSEVRADALEWRRIWVAERSEVEASIAQLERQQVEQEQALMQARLVAAESLAVRMERTLRQAARATGKRVRLDCSGLATRLDGDLIEPLAECLLHLIRNAVDHGIESGSERLAAGKPAEGTIRIAFTADADRVQVECSDDGRGFDAEGIAARGREQGLWSASSTPGPAQLQDLVTRSGFTTREQVSETSGRGLGLDVVAERMRDLRGELVLHSSPGRGASILLKLPNTLLTRSITVVRLGDFRLGLPAIDIERIVPVQRSELHPFGAGLGYLQTGVLTPALLLEAALRGESGQLPDDGRHWTGVIIQGANGLRRTLLVDEVIGTRNLVVQPLSIYLERQPQWLGSTVLGDGTVALVLAPGALSLEGLHTAAATTPPVPAAGTEPLAVLVVDDSLTSRRMLVRALERAGCSVRSAVDGLDALRHLREGPLDVLVMDLEMPRMNGLELCRWVREQPGLDALPVIMVTTRNSERQRSEAGLAGVTLYMTKPVVEQQLVDYARHYGEQWRRRQQASRMQRR